MTNVASHGRVIATYAYDGVGNLNGRWYDNGVTNVYQYDVENRLTNAVWYRGGTRLAGFAYQIKAGGARTNASETVNGVNQNFAWSYDNIYRLTNEVAGSLGSVGYQYDSVGNRTARNSDVIGVDTESSYTYDTNDELLVTSKGSYGYDWNGNENSTPDKVSYSYDVLNRLISYSTDYDGNDNRVSKQEDDPVYGQLKRYFLVDELNPNGYAQVVEEYHMSANLINNPVVLDRVYNWGLDLISQQQFNSNTLAPSVLSYYGYDGHGNVRFLMGTNGVVTDAYTYDACGTVIASSGSTPNNYLYCGQQYDADLGLYYNRARYLDVNTGRFMSADTFAGNNEDPLSLHKYLYCQNDPVDNVDQSGNDIEGLGLGDFGFNFSMAISSPAMQQALRVAFTGVEVPISSKIFWPAYKQVGFGTFSPDVNGQHQFWRFIGGNVGKWGDQGPQESCASRLSRALNDAGATIDPGQAQAGFVNDKKTSYRGRTGDGYAYIVSAWRMNRYLHQKYGEPAYNPKTVPDIEQIRTHVPQGSVAIFASSAYSDGHSGVLKSPDNDYKDPFVESSYELNKGIQVWILKP